MRRHCAKKCKGKDGTCPVSSLFTLNLKVNKATGEFESVECACVFSTSMCTFVVYLYHFQYENYPFSVSSCPGEYTDTWFDVEKEFNEVCAAIDKTTTTVAVDKGGNQT